MPTAPVRQVEHGVVILRQHLLCVATEVTVVVHKNRPPGMWLHPAGKTRHGFLLLARERTIKRLEFVILIFAHVSNTQQQWCQNRRIITTAYLPQSRFL
ncbi:MAG: hypothetical protein BWY63_03545 [Chloroflexi bacterium ADurb.Bin360]|nr:MAG: hypothetical protein BWY63_03545 [Chloroflexi bacterium ADurb.Bin360]